MHCYPWVGNCCALRCFFKSWEYIVTVLLNWIAGPSLRPRTSRTLLQLLPSPTLNPNPWPKIVPKVIPILVPRQSKSPSLDQNLELIPMLVPRQRMLTFTILTIPQMMTWMRNGKHSRRGNCNEKSWEKIQVLYLFTVTSEYWTPEYRASNSPYSNAYLSCDFAD